MICGYAKCTDNLVFHHIDSLDKEFNISGMLLTYSIDRLIIEASKCALVCHNCHGEIHAGLMAVPSALDFSAVERPDSLIEWHIGRS